MHLKTPTADLGVLSIPELERMGASAAENAAILGVVRCSEPGNRLTAPCPAERTAARSSVLSAARQWTELLLKAAADPYEPESAMRNRGAGADSVPFPAGGEHWFVTGHQPVLFHPGVWVKNFAVAKLARERQGVGLNLIVDNDVAGAPTISLPAGTPSSPRLTTISYDQRPNSGPWEEAAVASLEDFNSFGERAEAALRSFDESFAQDSLLPAFWKRVVRAQSRLKNPAWAFSAARAAVERQFGWGNLELPISQLCELNCFRRFAGQILSDLPRLRGIYNSVLADYRRINKLKSRTHPVPDLRSERDWLEAPFWVWRAGETIRRRLMSRRIGERMELGDGREVLATYRAADDFGAETALAELSRQNIRVRTRALTTTLFARLFLADLFVHGIGGAKYDEMTDRIIEQYWGFKAPTYATLSATVWLPFDTYPENASDVRELRVRLRNLEQHPERSLNAEATPAARTLVEEKQRLIREQQASRRERLSAAQRTCYARDAGRKRFRRLQEINRELASSTGELRQVLTAQLAETERRVSANGILQNREYAFCLYPAEKLRSFIDHVCQAVR